MKSGSWMFIGVITARMGKVGSKGETRNSIRLGKKGSDDSDEDYMVSEDGFIESDEEYCSLVEDESDDSLGGFFVEDEEDEEEYGEKNKVIKPRCGNGFHRSRSNGAGKSRKKKASYEEEVDCEDDFSVYKLKKKNIPSYRSDEFDEEEDLYVRETNNVVFEKTRKETQLSHTDKYCWSHTKHTRKKHEVSYREEEDVHDHDDSDEDDDEEFTLDTVVGIDEDELPATKKNKIGRPRMQETPICKGQKRKRNSKVLKEEGKKKPMKAKLLMKKSEFRVENQISRRKKKNPKALRARTRKLNVDFDSDFVHSGSSDYEYTVSEEERELIREAGKFCGRVTTGLRSSGGALGIIKEEEFLPVPKKFPARKGKKKVADLKLVVGKQVCGICLSEEGKRTVRGILNCCSHYFCFACIMEWSKVESRCPLCKQRFATVCRTVGEDGGHDLSDSVIQVPVRDQVYQPSEEELRGYFDPYENVLCTECLQGGDDALMLLCDICDSPAHSYCVGLGHEVPEGNWYCDGCRPTSLASLNSQPMNPTPELGAINTFSVASSPIATVRETFDLNELYVPETPLSQVAAPSPSPRHSMGDCQASSPGSGVGAVTLFERRRIRRQIHHLLNNRSRQFEGNDALFRASTISLFGSQISQNGATEPLHTVTSSRMAPQNTQHDGRVPECVTYSSYRREVLSPRLNSLRGQLLPHQASTSANHSFYGSPQCEFAGFDGRIGRDLGHQQLHPCSNPSNAGSDSRISPFQLREAPVSSRTLQGHLHIPF